MLYFLSINLDYTDLIIPAILTLVIWFYLIRSAVRADSISKNQQMILQTLVRIYKKHGATDEEMNELQQTFDATK